MLQICSDVSKQNSVIIMEKGNNTFMINFEKVLEIRVGVILVRSVL